MTWMTKDGNGDKGHYVVDGVPICSLEVDKNGTRLAPFKVGFVEFNELSHLCSICQRLEAKRRGGLRRVCMCLRCGVPKRSASQHKGDPNG